MRGFGNSVLRSGHDDVMEPSDGELWTRSRTGDRDAFAALFERHARVVYNYCFRRVGSWATAEDMLSIVFLEAWRRREKALPPEKVLPWLYGIATNHIYLGKRYLGVSATPSRRLGPLFGLMVRPGVRGRPSGL